MIVAAHRFAGAQSACGYPFFFGKRCGAGMRIRRRVAHVLCELCMFFCEFILVQLRVNWASFVVCVLCELLTNLSLHRVLRFACLPCSAG